MGRSLAANYLHKKCTVLNIGKLTNTSTSDYTINNVLLPVAKSTKDLGVIVASNLSPEEHINFIVAKANQRARLISRCFTSKNVQILLRAYKVYVRPTLEYNSVAWSPFLIKHVDKLESVQRHFTKYLPGFF